MYLAGATASNLCQW